MPDRKVLNNKLKKFYVILFSLIILLIPIAFLFGIINDRESYKEEAIQNIEKSWAKSQTLYAPAMILNIGKDKKNPVLSKILQHFFYCFYLICFLNLFVLFLLISHLTLPPSGTGNSKSPDKPGSFQAALRGCPWRQCVHPP